MTELRWDGDWRARAWAGLDAPWDVLIIGGGITGAGVLRAAARSGLRAVLLEARDFAWGTSSRSTKLVHGGLRYLLQGHVRLTRDSVRERERLLREVPDLVEPVPILLPLHQRRRRRELAHRPVLTAYEALAGRVPRRVPRAEVGWLAPSLNIADLRGALQYGEGRTDDARLVLRVLREAALMGAVALNDAEVTGLMETRGRITGARVRDRCTGVEEEVHASVVVNATGVWSDHLQAGAEPSLRLRPVRGGHLLFPGWRFPLATGVVVRSPRDGRPVSVIPWQGATLVGTTDRDHVGDLSQEAAITADETAYLLECLQGPFRSLELTGEDVLSTWAGVRPLVTAGRASSYDEARDHVVREKGGLITVAGGKLTTFQLAARDVLRAAEPYLLGPRSRPPLPAPSQVRHGRLAGRYGEEAATLTASSLPGEAEEVADTPVTWAEVRWAAQREAVHELEDLMLRRTRLGLLLPRGGEEVLEDVRKVCRDELGWDAARWERERHAYLDTVRRSYAVPGGTSTVSPSGTASTVPGSGPTGSPTGSPSG